jgi:hypothetical protein
MRHRLGPTAARVGVTCVLAAAVTVLVGCASESSPPSPSAAAAASGRSECPGSAKVARTGLDGAAADELERLQAKYEGMPGFLAAIDDGQGPVLILDSSGRPSWTPTEPGVRIARSCVDAELERTIQDVVPALRPPGNTIVSAGYDAIVDAIVVIGVPRPVLLGALGDRSAAIRAKAEAALLDGTLRVDG